MGKDNTQGQPADSNAENFAPQKTSNNLDNIDRVSLLREGQTQKPSENIQMAQAQTQTQDKSGDGPLSDYSNKHLPQFDKRDVEKLREVGQGTDGPQRPAETFELNLKNRSANHGHPDAVVYLPKNFDPSKPVNMVIYNHGWNSTASKSYNDSKLGAQMSNAPPNTMLVIPEWQATPDKESGAEGRLGQPGAYRNMLEEIMNKTPGMKGKKLEDLGDISIISHSAGYNPTTSMLADKGIASKVKSLTMLDSLYATAGADNWIRQNAAALASGEKQYTNIFHGTAGESKAQADRVRKIMHQAGMPPGQMYEDYNNQTKKLTANDITNHSIVFKHSKVTSGRDGAGPHGSMPDLYVREVEKAAAAKARERRSDIEEPVRRRAA